MLFFSPLQGSVTGEAFPYRAPPRQIIGGTVDRTVSI